MGYLLYLAYNSELSEVDKLAIDKSVFENRLAIANLFKKVYFKSKVLIISTSVGLFILISAPKNIGAVGLSGIPQAPIMKPYNCIGSTKSCVPGYTRLSIETSDKTFFELSQGQDRITNTNVDELVKLRGGDLSPLLELLRLILIVLFTPQTTKAFVPPARRAIVPAPVRPVQHAPRVAPKRQDNPIHRNAPKLKNQNNQDGTLTVAQRRNLPSSNDVILPEQDVTIRYRQAKYKLQKHGHHFGIPSTLTEKGRYKTERNIENMEHFLKEIVKLVVDGERIEGIYRGNKSNGFPAIHFYNSTTGKNAIFKKETKEFVSAWILTTRQMNDLKTIKDVGDV